MATSSATVGVHDGDEVVAADVADEPVGPVELDHGVLDDPRGRLDQPVAAHEPLLVVVGLEVVQVAVQDRERRPSRTCRSISSWIRMLPGRPVSGERFRISLARRSVPFTRASSSIGSNGLMM